MDPKKKFIVAMVVLGVIFFLTTGLGILKGKEASPPATKSGAGNANKERKWPQKIAGFTAIFRPKISPSDITYDSFNAGRFTFAIKSDKEAFRSLELCVMPTSDNNGNTSPSTFRYYAESSDSELKEQKGELAYLKNTDDEDADPPSKCSLAVLKQGGKLFITPASGAMIMMKHKNSRIMLCEKNRSGIYNHLNK
jgi:hypothetical protein